MIALAIDVSRLIRGFMRYLSQTEIRGEKYKTELRKHGR